MYFVTIIDVYFVHFVTALHKFCYNIYSPVSGGNYIFLTLIVTLIIIETEYCKHLTKIMPGY